MIWGVLYILTFHFIGDFIGQTHEMAVNKSTSIKWLTKHVIAYFNILMLGSFPLVLYGFIVGNDWLLLIPTYILVNCILHWITDYFTSKWSSKLWKEKDVHNFFVVIGADQLIHSFCLILTYVWLFI